MDGHEPEVPGEAPMLLSVADAARLLRLGRTTTYQLVMGGRIPSVKVGRRRLIPRRGLEDFVAGLVGDETVA